MKTDSERYFELRLLDVSYFINKSNVSCIKATLDTLYIHFNNAEPPLIFPMSWKQPRQILEHLMYHNDNFQWLHVGPYQIRNLPL